MKKKNNPLLEILRKARPQIDWFAMGEAVRLSEEIGKLDENTDMDRVASVCRRAAEFLTFRGVENAHSLAMELKVALESLELPIHESRKPPAAQY